MLAVGLISGTSADGIDAALVDVSGRFPDLAVRTLHWLTTSYPTSLRSALLRVAGGAATTAGEICRLHTAVGECFADAALRVCAAAGVDPAAVTVAGSHGQTVWHEPVPQGSGPLYPRSTLQIGQGQVIAERTGITTVADFRPRDIAAGGQGAPLVPMVDWLLFRHPSKGRVLLNIGGIANITALPAGCAMAAAGFDTGPGNMLVDAIVGDLTAGALAYDPDGRMAGQGSVHDGLLVELLAEPYYAVPPPKSTGRELFNREYARQWLRRGLELGLDGNAIVATATALTAASIAQAIERFVLVNGDFAEVIAAGGGIHNRVMMRELRVRLERLGLSLTTTAAYGVDPDAKEAIAFAVLACLTLQGEAGNLPAATGARHPAVLGSISPGASMRRQPWSLSPEAGGQASSGQEPPS